MLPDVLQDRAALYVAGAMTPAERENFELVLAFHAGTRAQVAALQEAAVCAALASAPAGRPPAALRSRLLQAVAEAPPPEAPARAAMVATDPAGRIEWINAEFTGLCGYTLDELRGRKPGEFLQGAGTDPRAVDRVRQAVRAHRPCRETLLNYHKDGSVYWVDIEVAPVLDDAGAPLWFVAREFARPGAHDTGRMKESGPVRG